MTVPDCAARVADHLDEFAGVDVVALLEHGMDELKARSPVFAAFARQVDLYLLALSLALESQAQSPAAPPQLGQCRAAAAVARHARRSMVTVDLSRRKRANPGGGSPGLRNGGKEKRATVQRQRSTAARRYCNRSRREVRS